MKLLPNVGCVAGQDGHDYSFQTVYRSGDRHGREEIESILGMCRRCGDIYLQPVTRLERLAEDREGFDETLPSRRQSIATQRQGLANEGFPSAIPMGGIVFGDTAEPTIQRERNVQFTSGSTGANSANTTRGSW